MKAGLLARVGACFAGVQFCLAAGWAVQILYLPTLVAQAGWPPSATVWLSMTHPAILVVSDFAVGLAADRIASRRRRLGPAVLGATLVSCGAFVLLPVVAARGSGPALLALMAVWAASTSALRAPPLQLIGRYAPAASQPWLIGMSMLGLGLVGALSPSVTASLRDVEPQGPFVLCGVALAVATIGIVAAERLLVRAECADAASAPLGGMTASTAARDAMPDRRTDRRGVLGIAAMAALSAGTAFQIHVFVNSAPLYGRFAVPGDVAYLAPVFWVGFSLFLLAAPRLIERFGASAVMAGGALVAAVVSLLLPSVGVLQLLVNLQFIVGCAAACAVLAAAAAALTLGRPGREGRFSGASSSLLALAALGCTALRSAGLETLHGAAAVVWWPAVAWFSAGLLVLAVRRRRGALP